jgi:sulfur carrier protein
MIINGKNITLNGEKTILDLLNSYGLSSDRVVVELNKEIISREAFNTTVLKEEDKVEIISFVGGG